MTAGCAWPIQGQGPAICCQAGPMFCCSTNLPLCPPPAVHASLLEKGIGFSELSPSGSVAPSICSSFHLCIHKCGVPEPRSLGKLTKKPVLLGT